MAREELSYLLKYFPEIEVQETAANGLEAVKLIEDLEPDLVFLDVQMPGLDGLGVIRRIREKGGHVPHFVLVTAFDQYALEAFRVEALDGPKPVEKERLGESVARARRIVEDRQQAESKLLEPPPSPKGMLAENQAAGSQQQPEPHRRRQRPYLRDHR